MKKIITLVIALSMIAAFAVNVAAVSSASKKTYDDYWYIQDIDNDYSVEFYTYMRPTVMFYQDDTETKITSSTAYVKLEWVLNPKYNTNIAFRIVMDQSYQRKSHYTIGHIEQDVATIYVSSLNSSSSTGSSGQKIYKSSTYSKSTIASSLIGNSSSKYYDSLGFSYWTSFGMNAYIYKNVKSGTSFDTGDYWGQSYVSESYSQIVNDNK